MFTEIEDEFLPGLAVWEDEVIKNYTSTIYHPKQTAKWTQYLNYDEKLDLLQIGVDGGLSFDISAGKVVAKGSFHYLDKEEVRPILMHIFSRESNSTFTNVRNSVCLSVCP